MSRPASVTASAVVGIIGSVLTLLLAGLIIGATLTPDRPSEPGPALLIGTGIMFGAFAALGIATAIGLLRLRRWARVSMLVFSGVLAPLMLLALVVGLVMPLPMAGADATAVSMVRRTMIVMYAVPLALSVWWLVLFNRESVRGAFEAGAGDAPAGGRPLAVSIIAWGILLGVLSVIAAALRMPAYFMGVELTGIAATTIYVLYAAVSGYLGSGLLRGSERARVLSIAWLGFFTLQSALVLAVPALRHRTFDQQMALATAGAPQMQGTFQAIALATMALTVAALIWAVWILARYRGKPGTE